MLKLSLAVRPDEDMDQAVGWKLLYTAHRKRVHLQQPIRPKITPINRAVNDLARVMNLDTEGCDFYQVECETEPCPPT